MAFVRNALGFLPNGIRFLVNAFCCSRHGFRSSAVHFIATVPMSVPAVACPFLRYEVPLVRCACRFVPCGELCPTLRFRSPRVGESSSRLRLRAWRTRSVLWTSPSSCFDTQSSSSGRYRVGARQREFERCARCTRAERVSLHGNACALEPQTVQFEPRVAVAAGVRSRFCGAEFRCCRTHFGCLAARSRPSGERLRSCGGRCRCSRGAFLPAVGICVVDIGVAVPAV